MGSFFSSLFGGHATTGAPLITGTPLVTGTPIVTGTPTVTSTPVPTAAPFTTIAAASAPTPWAPSAPTYTRLHAGVGSNVCLTNGGKLVTCDPSNSQQGWYLDPSGLLVNQADGSCLNIQSVTNSVPLSNQTCDPKNPNQLWTSPGAGKLVLAGNTNLSLDVPGGNATLGCPASTWFVNGLAPQNWTFA